MNTLTWFNYSINNRCELIFALFNNSNDILCIPNSSLIMFANSFAQSIYSSSLKTVFASCIKVYITLYNEFNWINTYYIVICKFATEKKILQTEWRLPNKIEILVYDFFGRNSNSTILTYCICIKDFNADKYFFKIKFVFFLYLRLSV
jgi:hypothetical protein